MTSWRDFQTAKERLRPLTDQERAARAEPVSTDTEESSSNVLRESRRVRRSSPIVEKVVFVLTVVVVFWETPILFALIGLVRHFHWQGSTGMWLGAAYLIAVHWHGLRKGRGMQLLVMWAALFVVAFVMDFMRYGGSGLGSDGLDCEWGRYALPC